MSKSRSVYDRIQAIDKIGDSTFRSNIPGLIEVEIGDAKQEAFHPQIKIKKWNNEANFSMRLRGSDGIFDATKDRVVYQSDEFAANFYPKEKAIEPSLLYPRLDNGNDGGFEFDITLYSRPAVDFLDFTVQTKNVILCEQPDLTPGDIRLGARRPLNVTGSIAIYHEYKCWHAKGGMDYGCGKVGHLFRPLVRDSAGNMAWGRFHIIHDRDGSPVIRLTIPGRYLDNAVYPILIDPFFGYLTQGGTSFPIYSIIATTEEFTPHAGTLESLSAVTQISGGTGIVAMCMYADAGGTSRKWSSITYSETYTDTTKTWRNMRAYQYPSYSFKAGEDLCVAVQGNNNIAKGTHNAFYDTVAGYTIRSSSVTNAWPPSWPTIAAWGTTSNARLTTNTIYRYWEDEMINIKTGEEIVLACFTLPASLASGVKIVFLNATTGDGNDIGDDVTTDYITQTAEVVTVTTPIASSITQGDYFTVSSYYYGSESTRAVWFDIDAAGTAPTGAAYVAADSKSEVDILSTDSANQVSAKVHAVVNVTGQFTSVDNNGSVTITSAQTGPPEAGTPDDYSAAGGSGTGSTTSVEDTAGVDNSVCRESDDLSGLYTWDMAGFNTEPTADTELFWYMYSTYFSTIVSPPQRVVFGKVADDVNDILVDTGTTLDALIKDVPTVAEFNARSLVAADYTVVADLGVVQSADHTVAIADIPNNAEFALRTLLAAEYTVVGDLGTVQSGDSFAIVNGTHGLVSIQDDIDEILIDTGTTLDTLIKDIPTVAEFNARSLVAADYTVVGDLGVVQTGDSFAIVNGAHGLVSIQDDVDAILIDTAQIGSAVGASISADIAAVKAETALIVADTNELQTDDIPGKIATLEGKVDTIDGIVDNILTDTSVIGAAGIGLSAIPWNADWDAQVQSEVTDALNSYDPPTNTELVAAFTEIKGATWAAGTDTLEHIRNKQTDIETDTAEIGSAVGASISADIAAVKAETALIVADTNELQTDNIPGTLSTIEGKIDTVDGIVDNILTDTAVIGAAGIGLSAIPWNAAWDAEVQSEVTDALNSYDPPTHAELILEINDVQTDIGNLNNPTAAAVADAVWDEAQVDHVGIGTFGIIASEIADILVDTAEIGAAGIGLGAIPWNAAWDAQVESEVTDALNSYDPPTRAEATADKDAVIAEVNANEAKIDIIQAVTDVLPNAGALTDIDTGVNNIEAKLPSKSKITGSDNVDGDIELDDATGALPAGAFANHPDIDLNADQSGVTVGTVNAIAAAGIDGILDEVVETEGNITMRQVLSILVANLAGTTAGGGTTTITFNTPNGNAARIEMTVDSDGDRSVVTLTP